jgi:hypothetical protein
VAEWDFNDELVLIEAARGWGAGGCWSDWEYALASAVLLPRRMAGGSTSASLEDDFLRSTERAFPDVAPRELPVKELPPAAAAVDDSAVREDDEPPLRLVAGALNLRLDDEDTVLITERAPDGSIWELIIAADPAAEVEEDALEDCSAARAAAAAAAATVLGHDVHILLSNSAPMREEDI